MQYRFTLFTPTYNRCEYLYPLYKNIDSFTFHDFEWIIVDDGSTDETSNIVERIKSEAHFPILYIKKNNEGKHTAYSIAISRAQGVYFVCLDDDDLFPSTSLQIFDEQWKMLESSKEYDLFWEVRGRVQRADGSIVTPTLNIDSDYNDVNYRLRFGGIEMQACQKTSVLRKEACVPKDFLFKEQCSNFPEGIRWSRAARKYKTRFINDVVRCYINRGGEALTKPNYGRGRSLAKTYNLIIHEIYSLNENGDLMKRYYKKMYLKTMLALSYHQCCVKANLSKYLNSKLDKAILLLFIPLSYLLFLIRK